MIETIEITPFSPRNQDETRALILAGLEEHWGFLDPNKNPDLEDISKTYAGEIFLLARRRGKIVGTGAMIRENRETGRIVRMSVAKEVRRCRIGSKILNALLMAARARGYRRLVLETTTGWQDAEAFYRRAGFQVSGYADGDTHFLLEL
jgi:GNAT superfamily N-acetyltransferase